VVGKRGFETRNRIAFKPLYKPLRENYVKVTKVVEAKKIYIHPLPGFLWIVQEILYW
jgi:hypothetical protein